MKPRIRKDVNGNWVCYSGFNAERKGFGSSPSRAYCSWRQA
jgi:hypothetical protein